ncbi:YlzJ-like family protein [Peribacillus tepidiphilus]|jgi:hypothetical protein|uniref:YlzJ-like family protein n=1 Tax=Peribacillus tepidiphilus TaxID=2652445 RepID=UPI0012924B94|nr:YlzJ-like family protein [Peribacillus tepidiphilus]
MILYTTVPNEWIFPVNQEQFNNLIQINYQGIPVMAQKTSDNKLIITKVLSTNPNDYLHDSIIPGTCITLSHPQINP